MDKHIFSKFYENYSKNGGRNNYGGALLFLFLHAKGRVRQRIAAPVAPPPPRPELRTATAHGCGGVVDGGGGGCGGCRDRIYGGGRGDSRFFISIVAVVIRNGSRMITGDVFVVVVAFHFQNGFRESAAEFRTTMLARCRL